MYTRLIIVVLIVAAVAVNTATAQSTVNSTATLNATTTALPNVTGVTSSVTTIAPSNGPGVTSNATTAASSGSTGSSNTTAATSRSTGSSNTTAATSGSTGSSNTTASNATTTSPTSTALSVGALTTSLSKAGCGTQQLCLTQPASCDPSNGSCYYISAQQLSGQTYQIGLSGSSPGYIAVALSTASSVGNNDTTYVCANNNGVVQFLFAYLNGNVLRVTSPVSVSSVNGSVNGNQIQCIFNATLPAGSTKALKFQVGFLTGSYTNQTLGNATVVFQKFADLSNPASHAITFKQSLTQAVLIVMVALSLTM